MDLPAWTKKLRRASFRGVQFHVDDREMEGGRRIKNHEYPKRNQNFAEDMGRSTREFSVDAYVIGDDWMARRDKIISACEKEGEGALVDHWGLNQRVKCLKFKVHETSAEGRICRIQMNFIESSPESFAPVAIAATADQLATSAKALISSVVADFNARRLQ